MLKEKKIKMNGFNPNVTIGVIGYCPLDTLNEIKDFFETLEGFHTVYIKTSSGRLYIREGDQ